MTVAELIAELQALDPGALVIMLSDPEGNSHAPLSGCWVRVYQEGNRDLEIGFPALTDDLRNRGYTEEDTIQNGKPAVILYPAW